MLKKQYIISILVTLLSFGFIATVVAGENDESTILGSDEFRFDAPETEIDVAARNHVYDQERLALIGSEAGAWQYNPNAAETKSDIAARNHDYDQRQLASVGTEAGNWEYSFNPSTDVSDVAGSDARDKDAVCSNC